MKTTTKAYLALGAVCIIWGTTYLFIRIGVVNFPAFLFCGVRQLAAGLILWMSFPFLKKKLSLRLVDIKRQIIPGILLIALGNGVVGWAERYIPSGLAALIVSSIPVYVALISIIGGKGKKELNGHIIAGLLIGCLGVILLFRDNLADLGNPDYLKGMLAAFAASFSWAIGTVYIKNSVVATDSYTNAALQFTIGGIAACIMSLFFDDYSQLSTITNESIWSLIYLTLLGSIFAYLCYLYALEHLPVGLVSTYAYINPFIAIILGYFVLDEAVTWVTALAFAATIGGVYWINKGYKKNKMVPDEQ